MIMIKLASSYNSDSFKNNATIGGAALGGTLGGGLGAVVGGGANALRTALKNRDLPEEERQSVLGSLGKGVLVGGAAGGLAGMGVGGVALRRGANKVIKDNPELIRSYGKVMRGFKNGQVSQKDIDDYVRHAFKGHL